MKTPGWLVVVSVGCAALGLTITWATQPWPAAVSATALAVLAFEAGKIGARWFDEQGGDGRG